MKSGILLAIVGALAALALIGCATNTSTPAGSNNSSSTTTTSTVISTTPNTTTAGETSQSNVQTINVSGDDFNTQKDIVKDITVTADETFRVILSSNATTGFSWAENAAIEDTAILQQVDHYFNESNAGEVVGSAGTEVWTFKALQTGTTTVTNEYSRPWEGGEKGVWTFTLNVTVK